MVAQENSSNLTDVLVEEQLQSPLDMVTVSQERKLHKLLSKTVHGTFVLLVI